MTVTLVACLACWGMFGASGQTAAIAAAPLRGHGAVMQSHSSRVVIGQEDDLLALVADLLSADDRKNVAHAAQQPI